MQNHLAAVDLAYRHPDASILFSSLCFSFGAVRTGLVGANGVGKSTLLELLAGLRSASAGSITRPGPIAYLPQTVRLEACATVADVIGFADELSALDRVLRGEGTSLDSELLENLWDLPEIVSVTFARLGLPPLSPQRPASSLSGGELTRVRLAGLLLRRPEFLLMDEPTNHLDTSAREFVYELVASWKKGMVVVSHDRRLLSEVDQICELHSSGVKFYGGNYGFYREQRELEKAAAEHALLAATLKLKEAQQAAREALQRQSRRSAAGHKKFVKRGIAPVVAGGLKRKAENTSGRLKARHEARVASAKQVVDAARRSTPLEHQITIDLERAEIPAHKRMVELQEVNYRYPFATSPLWPEPLNLEIMGPERLWLKGANGSGKSSLLDLIGGRRMASTGVVRTGSNRIALLDQQASLLDESMTLFGNLKRMAPLRPEHELRILLGRFLFEKETVFKPVPALSGGERVRAGLACLLGADQAPQILMVDEPTNNLDLMSIDELVSALRDYRGVLIIVSHDQTVVEEIGIDRVFELPQRTVKQANGGWNGIKAWPR
jgi:ATPase subunit of ABC transporter with duplicated ATPase domains